MRLFYIVFIYFTFYYYFFDTHLICYYYCCCYRSDVPSGVVVLSSGWWFPGAADLVLDSFGVERGMRVGCFSLAFVVERVEWMVVLEAVYCRDAVTWYVVEQH